MKKTDDTNKLIGGEHDLFAVYPDENGPHGCGPAGPGNR